ncbi:MAG: biotin transporter BioY [Bacillota bacterium]|nr:biotin transporter BioY [Bacillota bacterium]
MQGKVYKMTLVSMFAVLTIIGALIKFQTPLVPFSLQIFFVILSGLILGSKLGFLSQIVYIAIGLTGIPVFTGGGGLGYIFKPTFGYILGFAAAAFITGKIKEKFDSENITYKSLLFSSFVGIVSCYVLGVSYLYMHYKLIQGVNTDIAKVLTSGFLIFLPWDIIKIAAASWVAREVMKRVGVFKIQEI